MCQYEPRTHGEAMPESENMPEDATCIDCAYALRGLAEAVCPECARAFEPQDPSTYEIAGKTRSWRRWAKAPCLWTVFLSIGLTLYALNDASVPGSSSIDVMFEIFAPILGSIVLTDLIFRAIACRFHGRQSVPTTLASPARGRWRWIVFPTCFLVVCAAGIVNWPLMARFSMSRAAFDRINQQIASGMPVPTGEVWVGLYRVEIQDIDGYPMFITGSFMLEDRGFGKGIPRLGIPVVVDRCGGNWYVLKYPP